LAKQARCNNRNDGKEIRRQFALSKGLNSWSEVTLPSLIACAKEVPDNHPVKGFVFLQIATQLQQIQNRSIRDAKEAEERDSRQAYARTLLIQKMSLQAEQDQRKAKDRNENLEKCARYRHPEIRSKKEARRLGFFTATELRSYHRKTGRRPMAPRTGERPIGVKDDLFWLPSQCEALISVTEGRRLGIQLRKDVEPFGYRHARFGKSITYPVYRESDFELF
jgi:hypothetical protein